MGPKTQTQTHTFIGSNERVRNWKIRLSYNSFQDKRKSRGKEHSAEF